mmetsp:Transcript_40605/g.105414  ORF Transcript_40605/g.105414 Transcript_40605/m.105414 type:complete len:91 (+) Transcript_40605:504-776(+)
MSTAREDVLLCACACVCAYSCVRITSVCVCVHIYESVREYEGRSDILLSLFVFNFCPALFLFTLFFHLHFMLYHYYYYYYNLLNYYYHTS